jgi:hypothetical protein
MKSAASLAILALLFSTSLGADDEERTVLTPEQIKARSSELDGQVVTVSGLLTATG